ncbi:MAG TPA: NAD(+) synthase [Syntrophomonas sp.]|nr:NAD(+) synthase [Syntrophomonas sp.]
MNAEAVVEHLVDWLRKQVADAGASGVILGVSGGVDSAVAAVIAKKAFPDNCMALMLPCESNFMDLIHGQELAESFDIAYSVIELDNAFNLLLRQLESYIRIEGPRGKLLRANLKPRLRMLTLYYSAQARNYLVVGTSNKSELTVGYATKYGDNAVDLQLLGDLMKSEVYQLAEYLQVPQRIIEKPPSGGLWEGQTDEEEMGITYDQLEQYITNDSGDPAVVERIKRMEQKSEHKRKPVPIALVPDIVRK